MSKTGIISTYISKCDKLYESDNITEIKDFIEEMISVYNNEIEGFSKNLESRPMMRAYEKISMLDAKKDLKRIKAILENHRANIKSGLFQNNLSQGININNIATSDVNLNVNITFDQIIQNINELSDDVISSEEKEEIEDRIRSLEVAVHLGDKNKVESKLKRLMAFALEKGPAVITLVSSAISLLKDSILPLF